MEALSALGVAAAAIQFFEFTRRTLKDYGDLRQGGSPLRVNQFQRNATQLLSLVEAIDHRPSSTHQVGQTIDYHDKAVGDVVAECHQLANELLQTLQLLGPKSSQSSWYTFRQAIATQWKSEKLSDFEKRIAACQSRLVLQLLARMETKIDQYGTQSQIQLGRLEGNQARVMEVVAFTHQHLTAAAAKQQNEIVSAILTFSTGEKRIITGGLQETLPEDAEECQSVFGATEGQSGRIITLRSGQGGKRSEAVIDDSSALQTAVLRLLWFRQFAERYDMVKDNHQGTFEWIWSFKADQPGNSLNLQRWLSSPSGGVYWINGKPGSGKTTLMKYIQKSPLTRKYLEAWAPTGKVLVASFFFWLLGPSILQKSIQGLLRSILHDILDKAPALIPAVVPELCQELLTHGIGAFPEAPTENELLRWFKRLLSHASPQFRFFLIIDGVDEYTGNYSELLSMLVNHASSSPYTKVILSSRPILACSEALSSFPGLRLQDHSFDDIRRYIDDTLGQRFVQRVNAPHEERLSLQSDIATKSAGVFLWVVLVVVSLQEGVTNGDQIAELRQRLDQLPSDLESLYAQIIRRIPQSYVHQAADLFGIMLQGLEYESHRCEPYHISALQLIYATDDAVSAVMAPIKELSVCEQEARLDELDRRIRSRCQGLLEVNVKVIERENESQFLSKPRLQPMASQQIELNREDKNLSRQEVKQFLPSTRLAPCVEFIHRSAVEFFQTSLGTGVLSASREIIPKQALLWSMSRMLKAYPSPQLLGKSRNIRTYFMGLCFRSLQDIKENDLSGNLMPLEVVRDFDNTVQHHWGTASVIGFTGQKEVLPPVHHEYDEALRPVPGVPRSTIWVTNVKGHWSRSLYLRHVTHIGIDENLFRELDWQGFTSIALLVPLPTYLEANLDATVREAGEMRTEATRLLCLWLRSKIEFEMDALERILGKYWNLGHATPQDENMHQSWAHAEIAEGPFTEANYQLITMLLSKGADPNHCFYEEVDTIWAKFLTTIPLFQVYYERVSLPAKDQRRPEKSRQWLSKIITVLIHHGADLNLQIQMNVEDYRSTRTLHRTIDSGWAEDLKLPARFVLKDVLMIRAWRFVDFLTTHAGSFAGGLKIDQSIYKPQESPSRVQKMKVSLSKLFGKEKRRGERSS